MPDPLAPATAIVQPSGARGAELPLAQRGISLSDLLRCFGMIGALGFGGVLPVAIHELVYKRYWLSQDEFAEILSLCQVLPGPNIINLAVVFGTRVAGWRGGLICLVGLLGLPVAIVVILAGVYAGFSEVEMVRRAITMVAAAAAGIVCAISARLLWPLRRRPLALLTVALAVISIAVLRLPLFAVIATLAPLSIALTLWEYRNAR